MHNALPTNELRRRREAFNVTWDIPTAVKLQKLPCIVLGTPYAREEATLASKPRHGNHAVKLNIEGGGDTDEVWKGGSLAVEEEAYEEAEEEAPKDEAKIQVKHKPSFMFDVYSPHAEGTVWLPKGVDKC
ncbi:hypothetical protein RJT34_09188 [Clitoria ternatea]|uniref:Uncharacterized protein n=1 Tax=Clitoria ternatea TaxID=43366 RepID=A0AAN9K6P3_CLITE